jgi:putative chitinase
MITPTLLKKVFPRCGYPDLWVRPLNEAMRRFSIETPEQVAAFLGQIGVETDQLTKVEENLNYAPGRISAVWPQRFPDPMKAKLYSRNPEKLANAVYANRLGNGGEETGDGYRFRGRGLIQITGRDNYGWVGELFSIDLINLPDTLLEPRYAALSAAAFWNKHDLNDKPFDVITKTISGSLDTLTQRDRYRVYALELLNGDRPASAAGVPAIPVDTDGHSGAPLRTPVPEGAVATQTWFD